MITDIHFYSVIKLIIQSLNVHLNFNYRIFSFWASNDIFKFN